MMPASEFAAFIGLDWEDEAHSVCIFPADGGAAQHGEVKHDPNGIADWVLGLRQ